eukprot:scaffold7382_cov406-Prasinococcus_capsulatus_cf.AAC.30
MIVLFLQELQEDVHYLSIQRHGDTLTGPPRLEGGCPPFLPELGHGRQHRRGVLPTPSLSSGGVLVLDRTANAPQAYVHPEKAPQGRPPTGPAPSVRKRPANRSSPGTRSHPAPLLRSAGGPRPPSPRCSSRQPNPSFRARRRGLRLRLRLQVQQAPAWRALSLSLARSLARSLYPSVRPSGGAAASPSGFARKGASEGASRARNRAPQPPEERASEPAGARAFPPSGPPRNAAERTNPGPDPRRVRGMCAGCHLAPQRGGTPRHAGGVTPCEKRGGRGAPRMPVRPRRGPVGGALRRPPATGAGARGGQIGRRWAGGVDAPDFVPGARGSGGGGR